MKFSKGSKLKEAYFGAGCFWGVEEAFLKTEGVVDTEVGYAGGDDEEYANPTYKQVCTGETEHAEVVKVIYDSQEVSYEELVRLFFEIHNPTQFNRQGPDYGSQYRSIVLYKSSEEKEIVEHVKRDLASEYERKIVTLVEPFEVFWKAEEYHQKYFLKNGGGACHIV
jgi:peptide-methionine (S)-S-oxide reductase